ncbi:head-to-tail adaptor [Bacillus phage 031MP004]|nr:head-to-tail adaptor [Bacillus phage 022DV001]QFG05419.1 head-to-tail adaptor [Bacillus phage 031MP003]QFG05509.1 head-to-tail adaptor [Bacillus phage 031MP002]QFG05596.1 head-to-tail adaptor [Bacillus phage 031MP004]QFG05770.1 head-to-tail adaptor [Bacillus phage 055SW001]
MEISEVRDYLSKLPEAMTAAFSGLSAEEQDKQIFAALELLGDNYRTDVITARAAALQLLFTLEGDDEEYARLKRHGVQSFSTKGVSVSFGSLDALSPEVRRILGEPTKGSDSVFVGRLI